MTKLKHCPFCGGDGSVTTNANEKIVFGNCWNCGARGQVIKYNDRLRDEHIKEASDVWNMRVDEGRGVNTYTFVLGGHSNGC